MKIKLKFLGAAENVTGSCYLVEAGESRILVDCGLYQERDFTSRNWAEFPVPPASIDAVLLTHAHLDHCGRIPKLVKEGFRGKVICTPATAEIASIIMKDSAYLMEEDIKHKQYRHKKAGKTSPFPYEPLYSMEDAERTIPLFDGAPYNKPISVAPGMTAEFREAGHVFGSAIIRLVVGEGNAARRILFSGDVGRDNQPIIEDPEHFSDVDYVLVESTYGDRTHPEVASIPGELERIINETHKAHGNIIIPSFALERTQELLYHLNSLLQENKIPHLMTFVDSPMAIKITDVFKKHPELFDAEMRERLARGEHPCDFPNLVMSQSVDQSKAINNIKGSAIIIAGSGMCSGGRVKHHLVNNISRPESTILFVGYQAFGTLGRIILDRPDTVRIFGQEHDVKARVERIEGFSAHADRNEIVEWLSSLARPPKKVFVVHGEKEAASTFRTFLAEKTGWDCVVAQYEQEFLLD